MKRAHLFGFLARGTSGTFRKDRTIGRFDDLRAPRVKNYQPLAAQDDVFGMDFF